ncbi:MAG TPA: L-2-hydroxyglutarate oxidase [Planctomycetota bacterium]|nr:L-2-hydroxyglutarate oxidase [Planctomycetota bacterium]
MEYDIAIIGGGIVGLAAGLALVKRKPGARICVLEKETEVGAHQTGNNSGVIHSGLYYKPGSAKAQTCVEGARRMVEFCQEHAIPYDICGKIVVATHESELPALAELYRRGKANGVAGLEEIGPERFKEFEPHAVGIKALRVPGTGIVDYRVVAKKYAELIVAQGGSVQTGVKVNVVRAARLQSDGEVLSTSIGEIRAKAVINCAGLFSDRVARASGAKPDAKVVPFRGEYYKLKPAAQHLVKGLIYPVPDARFPFLGVHFTRMIGGGVEAGPNAVLALKREGYTRFSFNFRDAIESLTYPGFWRLAFKYGRTGIGEMWRSFSKRAFVRALQKLVPEIQVKDLEDGGAGVRAQALLPDGSLVDDFRIVRSEHAIHVLNAPSPAATASLAIGERVAEMARGLA